MASKSRDLREPIRGKKSFKGKKLSRCRWCNSEIFGRRRSFCSDACVHEHKLRSDVGYMRKAVFERDNGVCSLCKRDCEQLRKDALEILKSNYEDAVKFLKDFGYPERRIKSFIKNKEKGFALWDADHIIPVTRGGGGCSLEGMRTLCVPCHDVVTHDQRRMVALGISGNQTILWDDNKLYSDTNND
nr:hypothetical protein GTC16762_30900 [Pigmentibacter ruber]